jgi:hypothetical protein
MHQDTVKGGGKFRSDQKIQKIFIFCLPDETETLLRT